MKIYVKNVGKEMFTSSNGNMFTSNAIDVDIAGIKIKMQCSVPNQREIVYSEKVGVMNAGVPVFQVARQVKNISYFRLTSERALAIAQYRNLLTARPTSIGDWFLQYPQKNHLNQNDRLAIHEVQIKAGATILSDIEIDREQDENVFESDILDLRNKYPDKIVSPTIDIGIETDDLFGRKVDKIIKNEFDRFSVIYRSIPDNFPNWIDLSVRIFGKDIWCNVVGILSRWSGKKRISNIPRPFLFGAHSTSLGLPWMVSAVKPVNLNASTLCFDLAPAGTRYEQSRSDAIQIQDIEFANARGHTINGTFFKKFVQSKYGLQQSLLSFLRM